MNKKLSVGTALLILTIVISSFALQTSIGSQQAVFNDTIQFPGEKHFANMQQLTFGGDNA